MVPGAGVGEAGLWEWLISLERSIGFERGMKWVCFTRPMVWDIGVVMDAVCGRFYCRFITVLFTKKLGT